MLTRFKRNVTTLFLDPAWQGKREYKKGEKFNIILSPSLYWVKKVQLPVKYLREVKKLLPSIFEEILPEGHFSYSAFKEGDSYYIFAYEDKKILQLLEAQGISNANVAGVYFAQAELKTSDTAYAINDTEVVYTKDDIVIVAPKIWFKDCKPLALDKHKIHSQKITLEQYGHIVDKGSLYKIAIIVIALILIITTEIFITKAKTAEIENAQSRLFDKYKLYPTMMQNKAILAKYKDIYEKQTKLRALIGAFLKLPLKKEQKITSIIYKNNRLHVKISALQPSQEATVFQGFKKKYGAYKIEYKRDGANVEVML